MIEYIPHPRQSGFTTVAAGVVQINKASFKSKTEIIFITLG